MKDKNSRCCYYCRQRLLKEQMTLIEHNSSPKWICPRCQQRHTDKAEATRATISYHELLGGRYRVLARRSCA